MTNAKSGEFEERLNCGSVRQPAVGDAPRSDDLCAQVACVMRPERALGTPGARLLALEGDVVGLRGASPRDPIIAHFQSTATSNVGKPAAST